MTDSLRLGTVALVLGMTLGSPVATAQSGTHEIGQLAGCFEVSYRFVEDGASDIFAGRAMVAKEWVGLRQTGEGTIVLEHMLFAGDAFFPHWHEIWSRHTDRQVWTQEVRGGAPGPDADLRYSCTAPWVANRWECHAGRSKKPLRDDKRDYEWLDRRNVLLVTPNGWVQNEHNGKMSAAGRPVSYEMGWIVYRRLDDQQCGTAPSKVPRNGTRTSAP